MTDPDGLLSIRLAAARFERNPKKIEDDIVQNRLPCGMLARGWVGTALPELPAYTGGRWDGEIIATVETHFPGELLHTYAYRYTVTIDDQLRVVHELDIQECRAGGFWYLEQVAHDGDNIGGFEALLLDRQPCVVQILGPRDGEFLHRRNPAWFPPPPFLVWLRDKPIITHDDVRVLAADLDALYGTDPQR